MKAQKATEKKRFVPSDAEKAFIRQQISELKAPALVLMERNPSPLKSACTATLILDPLRSKLKAQGHGENIFEALIQAKEAMKKKIARYGAPSSDEERELFIEMIKRKIPIH